MWQTYYSPATTDQALRLLAEHGAESRVIAGGTDLLVELRRGVRRVPALIDLTRAEGLDRIYLDDEGIVHIGPLVTHNHVVASKLLAERGFPLALACLQVGTPLLRNRATVAGNLVTASPANDTITALWALNARVTLRSLRAERTLSLAEFYRGVRQTALAEDELVTDISFPALAPNQRGVFVKLGLRRSHAIALVNAAAVLSFENEVVTGARITLGSVAPTIVRAPDAEAELLGRRLTHERIEMAAGLAASAATPIDDIRGGAQYRSEMVQVLVRRALVSLRHHSERAVFPGAPPLLWGKGDGRYSPLAGGGLRHQRDDEPIECTVNGEHVRVEGANHKTLLDMLRGDLKLTGTKEGCGEGECGACTLWMDGIAVLACLVPAPRAHGAQITTIESLGRDGALHPVQQAFIDEGAIQCGYCTPGFVMSGANLLQEIPHPTIEQIVAGLEGNLCRCVGYYKIVRAIERAAEGQCHDVT